MTLYHSGERSCTECIQYVLFALFREHGKSDSVDSSPQTDCP